MLANFVCILFFYLFIFFGGGGGCSRKIWPRTVPKSKINKKSHICGLLNKMLTAEMCSENSPFFWQPNKDF